jgi:hypothetical protein
MKRILITNNTLGPRAGTEMYVRDVALALLQAGWQPVAFSTELGAVAEELRSMTIPVVSDLALLPFRPDVIHAHHHLDAMAAIQRFPGVPVIYFCHGFLPWEETPVRHPQIFRYVAVDEICRERLVIEHAIPESQVEVLLNFVDLRRFHPRPPLPEKPQRALIFGNLLRPGHPVYDAVRGACAARGITLDIAGAAAGASSSQPELQLPQYDLVFAKARCALEAMAVGCAVIVCDALGMGGLVTSETFDTLRPLNFGLRTLRRNPNPTQRDVEEQLDLYDAGQSSQVAERIRAEADQSLIVRRLMALYEEAMASGSNGNSTGAPIELSAEAQAIADYLLFLARDTKEGRRALFTLLESQQLNHSQAGQLATLQAQLATQEAQHAALVARHAALESAHTTIVFAHAALETGDATLQAAHTRLAAEHVAVSAERGGLARERDALVKECAALGGENGALKAQRDALEKQLTDTQRWVGELEKKLQRFKGVRRFLPRWLVH